MFACQPAHKLNFVHICRYIYHPHIPSTQAHCICTTYLPIMSQRIIAWNKSTVSLLLLRLGHQYGLRQRTGCVFMCVYVCKRESETQKKRGKEEGREGDDAIDWQHYWMALANVTMRWKVQRTASGPYRLQCSLQPTVQRCWTNK